MKEIEYKFIASFNLHELPARDEEKRYEQAYISSGDPEVRIRRTMSNTYPYTRIPGTYFLAVKAGHGLVREEIEFPLSDEYGDAIFALIKRPIKKTRWTIGGWEIDIFDGSLEGLILAEHEVDSEHDPVPPVPWGLFLDKDVTYDPAFKNKALYNMSQDEMYTELYRALEAK